MTRVSVVIPAYNEASLLPDCLDSLAAQVYSGSIEVIVVDNASDDATAAVAAARGVTVVSEPVRGYSRALARGFEAASGEIVATTDADTVVPPDWIARIVSAYDEHPDVVAVGGEIVFCEPNASARLFTRGILPFLNRVDRMNPAGPHLWGANFSVRRSAFQASGGWSTDFNLQTDTELSERLRAFGRVVLLETLPVYTSCRRWNRSLVRSLFLYVTNFLSFQILRRPLWRSFPDIREGAAAAGSVPVGASDRAGTSPALGIVTVPLGRGLRRRGAAWAGALALFAGVVYESLSPWSSAFGTTHWHGAADRRVVALTFDDGPNGATTSKVLDTLRAERVHATFFLVGENVRRDPGTAARIAREGHVVGNHSDTHPMGFALLPTAEIRAEVDRAERSIAVATGEAPRYFRPPQGIRSPWLSDVLAADSLVDVTWDDAPGDWHPKTADSLVKETLARAHPGAIILLHDGLENAAGISRNPTVEALPRIIDDLRARGYAFVTVADLLRDEPALATPGAAGVRAATGSP